MWVVADKLQSDYYLLFIKSIFLWISFDGVYIRILIDNNIKVLQPNGTYCFQAISSIGMLVIRGILFVYSSPIQRVKNARSTKNQEAIVGKLDPKFYYALLQVPPLPSTLF